MSANTQSNTVIMTGNYNAKIQRSAWLNRWALAIVYTWFGLLKILWKSPAEELVTRLYNLTLKPVVSIEFFLPAFGLMECMIGLLWLFPKYTRIAFWAMIIHMVATFLPVVMLPDMTWQSFMTLTLIGQYIFKNLVMLAAAYFVYALSKTNINHSLTTTPIRRRTVQPA